MVPIAVEVVEWPGKQQPLPAGGGDDAVVVGGGGDCWPSMPGECKDQ